MTDHGVLVSVLAVGAITLCALGKSEGSSVCAWLAVALVLLG